MWSASTPGSWPDIERCWNDIYARVAASGESVRIVGHAQPLGRRFDVFVSKVHDDANDKVAIVFRDNLKKRRSNEELQQLAADLSRAYRRQNEVTTAFAEREPDQCEPVY